jgi:hypothetical protein
MVFNCSAALANPHRHPTAFPSQALAAVRSGNQPSLEPLVLAAVSATLFSPSIWRALTTRQPRTIGLRSGRYLKRSGPHFTFRVTWIALAPSSSPVTNLATRRVKRGRIVNDSELLEVTSHTIQADHRSGRYRSRSGPHFTGLSL